MVIGVKCHHCERIFRMEVPEEDLTLPEALQKVSECIACGVKRNLEVVSLVEGKLPSLEEWKKGIEAQGFIIWDSLDEVRAAGIEPDMKTNDIQGKIGDEFIYLNWTVGPDNKYYYYVEKDTFEAMKS